MSRWSGADLQEGDFFAIDQERFLAVRDFYFVFDIPDGLAAEADLFVGMAGGFGRQGEQEDLTQFEVLEVRAGFDEGRVQSRSRSRLGASILRDSTASNGIQR